MKETTKSIIEDLCERYERLKECYADIINAVETLCEMYREKGTLLVCGNGGSAADSLHIVGELMKGFALKRSLSEKEGAIFMEEPDGWYISKNLQKTLPAVSLVGETALSSACINDNEPDMVFAQQVYGYGKEKDTLLAISTSGSSRNVVLAVQVARAKGMKVISLTGCKRSILATLSDVTIAVPEGETYRIQELHLPVYHAICKALENEFFGE